MIWVEQAVVLALHEEQIAEHGGSSGIRDINLLESALARPQHLFAYGEPDLADLAAAYAFGLAKNHAFIDGNKRVSLVVTETFLGLNGHSLQVDDTQCLHTWLALAEGQLDEPTLAGWLRDHIA
jgi:death-on-curing protein